MGCPWRTAGKAAVERAFVYSVTVRQERTADELRQLGDCTGSGGQWLGDRIRAALATLDEVADAASESDGSEPEHSVFARHETAFSRTAADDVGGSIILHEMGVTSLLQLRAHGDQPIGRAADDVQMQRVGVLFRLPRNLTHGIVLFHRTSGRSAVSAVRAAVRRCVPGAIVELTPIVDDAALQAAVDRDRVTEIQLIEPAPDDGTLDVTAGVGGRVMLKHTYRIERGGSLLIPELKQLVRKVRERAGIRLALGGKDYEDIKVEVVLPNGTPKKYSLARIDGGFAMTLDVDISSAGADPSGFASQRIGRALARTMDVWYNAA